jgi:hypothetical protein
MGPRNSNTVCLLESPQGLLTTHVGDPVPTASLSVIGSSAQELVFPSGNEVQLNCSNPVRLKEHWQPFLTPESWEQAPNPTANYARSSPQEAIEPTLASFLPTSTDKNTTHVIFGPELRTHWNCKDKCSYQVPESTLKGQIQLWTGEQWFHYPLRERKAKNME